VRILLVLNGLSVIYRTVYDVDWSDDSLQTVTWNMREFILGVGAIILGIL
jgi:hypothetical protein